MTELYRGLLYLFSRIVQSKFCFGTFCLVVLYIWNVIPSQYLPISNDSSNISSHLQKLLRIVFRNLGGLSRKALYEGYGC